MKIDTSLGVIIETSLGPFSLTDNVEYGTLDMWFKLNETDNIEVEVDGNHVKISPKWDELEPEPKWG